MNLSKESTVPQSELILIEFRPVNLTRDVSNCIDMLEDNFIASFGSTERMKGEDGKGVERYIECLKKKLEADPWSVVHGWVEGKIVSTLELDRCKREPGLGYVNSIHLIPALRKTGASNQLDLYIKDYFRRRKYDGALVAVGRNNPGAIRFYEKYGWRFDSQRKDIPELNFMRLSKEALWEQQSLERQDSKTLVK